MFRFTLFSLLVVVVAGLNKTAAPCTNIGPELWNNKIMKEGECIKAYPQDYWVVMQGDCNLVLYNNQDLRKPNNVWASNTANKGAQPCRLKMEPNNDLVILDNNDKRIWHTNTGGKGVPGGFAEMDNDRNFRIWAGNGAQIWSSKSSLAVANNTDPYVDNI